MYFEEIKKAAIEIWNTYDDSYGYASEKIGIINKMNKNDARYIVDMFDPINQQILLSKVSKDARQYIIGELCKN